MAISNPKPQPLPGSLVERLMTTVRPEFRVDVFRPPRDSTVFFAGVCVVPHCPIMVSNTARGLCNGHYQHWRVEHRDTGAEFDAWLISEGERTRRRYEPPPACSVRLCLRAAKAHGLCNRHHANWTRIGRPDLADWLGRTLYSPPDPNRNGAGERVCEFFTGCPRWTDGPTMFFCRHHWHRWVRHGRPDLPQWFEELRNEGDPKLRLGHLPPRLRLEFQFGIQCRNDEATKRTMQRMLREAVWIVERGIERGLTSLRDLDEDMLKDIVGTTRATRTSIKSTSMQFIRDTQLRLHILAVDDPWDDQFPRDVWDLRVLGIAHDTVRYLRFEKIAQPWLKALTKQWIRWRLSQGLDPSTLAINVYAVAYFSGYLSSDLGPAELTGELIEAWLAKAALDYPDPDSRRNKPASVATLLRDAHRHGWQPELPPTAMLWDHSPPRKHPAPRWIPEEVMAQIQSEASLALFPSPDGQVILRIMIDCGLRLKDARKLPLDCVVRDASGAPYLAWINYKMKERPAFFPVSEPLAEHIRAQQQRTAARFPNGSPWLFPSGMANLDGAKAISSSGFKLQLNRWLATIALTYNDRPHRVTPHQFRHTVGTRLINADVPQHVVQHLLDHMTPQMTAVYARLLDKTVRAHWERATKVNGEGHVVDLDPEHPLADAQWMRLSMTRAKVTLPNGYCGAPIQTDCEFANPCLDCRFFLTTGDFIDAHRRQRDDTARLITDAEAAGMKRIAEKNTRTLIKLETLITTLEKIGPRQIVAGGQIEDLDAAS